MSTSFSSKDDPAALVTAHKILGRMKEFIEKDYERPLRRTSGRQAPARLSGAHKRKGIPEKKMV